MARPIKALPSNLGITERTVKAHLTSIYNKLGVDSRAAAIANWTAVHGITEVEQARRNRYGEKRSKSQEGHIKFSPAANEIDHLSDSPSEKETSSVKDEASVKDEVSDDEETDEVAVVLKTRADNLAGYRTMYEDENGDVLRYTQEEYDVERAKLASKLSSYQEAQIEIMARQAVKADSRLEARVDRLKHQMQGVVIMMEGLKKVVIVTAAVKAAENAGAEAVSSAYIKCAPFSFATLLGSWLGERHSNQQEQCDSPCWFEELIPQFMDMCFNDCPIEVESENPWPLCECPADVSLVECVYIHHTHWLYLGLLIGSCVTSVILYLIYKIKLHLMMVPNLRYMNLDRLCENPYCAFGNQPQDADVILLNGQVIPLCCTCVGIPNVHPENPHMIAIKCNPEPQTCSVCSFPAVYSCVRCLEPLCFSVFHTENDLYCYQVHSVRCPDGNYVAPWYARMAELVESVKDKILQDESVIDLIQAKQVSLSEFIHESRQSFRTLLSEGIHGLQTMWSVKLQEFKQLVNQQSNRLKGFLARILIDVTQVAIQKLLDSLGLLKPLTTLAILEAVQLSLELVTLAGDCGVAPGGVAALTVYLVWAVKGPSITIAVLCGICVGILKACESMETPEPMTPKKVFERGLEMYSPLNGQTPIHTRDHVEGEYRSKKFTVKRVRALIAFMLVIYAAVCIQGCSNRDPDFEKMDLYDADGQFVGTTPVKGVDAGADWYANVLLALAIVGVTAIGIGAFKSLSGMRQRLCLFYQGEPDSEPAATPTRPPSSSAVNAEATRPPSSSAFNAETMQMHLTSAANSDWPTQSEITFVLDTGCNNAVYPDGPPPLTGESSSEDEQIQVMGKGRGKGDPEPVKGKGKSKDKSRNDGYVNDPARGIQHVPKPFVPFMGPCLFGFKGQCRALMRVPGTPRLKTCCNPQIENSLYCRHHQGEKGGVLPKVSNYFNFADLNRTFLDAGMPTPNLDRLPFKVGIFLLENEFRGAIWKKIKNVKNTPLKNFCQRLGINTPAGWRKIQFQEALLLNAGHPRFAETLTWCLDEDGRPFDNPVPADYAAELQRQRTAGHADRWYQEYEAGIAFEEFQ